MGQKLSVKHISETLENMNQNIDKLAEKIAEQDTIDPKETPEPQYKSQLVVQSMAAEN